MREFKNKSDYSLRVFMKGQKKPVYTLRYVNNILGAFNWLKSSRNYKDFFYIDVYVRRSGRFLKRFYYDNYPPKRLT